jgi:hypothetical protein
MTLGVKQLEIINVANRNAEFRRDVIELDGFDGFGMQAAQIHGQTTIDENPYVVITLECERLAALILKLRVDLGREAKVMGLTLLVYTAISKASIVQGKERQALKREQTVCLRCEEEL